jgi:hypothetical protein
VVPRERGDAADGELGGVVEVVDDDGAEAREEELQHGVAADVARPARAVLVRARPVCLEDFLGGMASSTSPLKGLGIPSQT